jgi:hypothetical protein
MSTRYLSVASFQSWSRNDITSDTAHIEEAIQTSEEWLDDRAGRTLVPVTDSTDSSVRSFVVGPRTDVLFIPDCAEITSVVEDGTTLTAGTHYQAEPLNNLDPDSQAYRPYDRLVRLDAYWETDGRRATVTIDGKWGWSEIPKSVVTACRILTNDWLMNRDVRLGVVGSTVDGFSIGVRQNPYVLSAIETIRGPKSWGVG